MFNEANKRQVLEMQSKCYSERIGKIYGDFVVTDVWYDWDAKKQMWKLACLNCGKEKITYNGKDYVKGKNSGICSCRVKARKEEKEREKAEKTANKRGSDKWIGKTVGMWKILAWDGRRWSVECQKCKKIIKKTAAELLKENPPVCKCTFVKYTYSDEKWIGERIGHLRIESYDSTNYRFICQCDCGNVVSIRPTDLMSGAYSTCGLGCKFHLEKSITHGLSKDRLYKIWYGMKERCYNPNSHSYKTYGGRGIDICNEWREDVAAFRSWALNNGYRDDLSIDRIDNDRGYYPDNCRWATDKEQANNKHPRYTFTPKPPKGSIKYKRKLEWEIGGETKSAIEWCEQYGVSMPFVMYRIKNKGMTPLEALTTPKETMGRPYKAETES